MDRNFDIAQCAYDNMTPYDEEERAEKLERRRQWEEEKADMDRDDEP